MKAFHDEAEAREWLKEPVWKHLSKEVPASGCLIQKDDLIQEYVFREYASKYSMRHRRQTVHLIMNRPHVSCSSDMLSQGASA